MGPGHLPRGRVPTIVTELDSTTKAILARNPWNADFGGGSRSSTSAGGRSPGLRIGPSSWGATARPTGPPASSAGIAWQAPAAPGSIHAPPAGELELAAGERTEIRVLLGEADTEGEAADLIRHGAGSTSAAALADVAAYWDEACWGPQGPDPDRSMDILLNSWLLYQTLACRLWARTAFYQAGGAYGFRDQLQDVIALTISRRALVREHLLRAAAQQFPAGDVQHWWHPPTGRGVRTRISDDRLWLPYAVDRYLAVTGDTGILDEMVPFIEGPELRPDQDDAYFQPDRSWESASLFEHCARAIEVSLAVGAHGLPLIGSGDWNDGMNRVGQRGPRRERLAGLVPAHGPRRDGSDRRGPRGATSAPIAGAPT